MKYDSFFIKGQSHDICQDYALCGETSDLVYAMISDGCSMMNNEGTCIPHPTSDLGSRLVCHSAKKVLEHIVGKGERAEISDSFVELLAASMITNQKMLNMNSCIADATLSLLCVRENLITVRSIGDGAIVVEKNDGSIKIFEREYTPNYPEYISYIMHLDANIRYYDDLKPELKEFITTIGSDGSVKTTEHKKQLLAKSVDNIKVFRQPELKSISVFSDGITDMIRGKNFLLSEEAGKSVSTIAAVECLLDIKNPNGMFVRRKLKAIARNQDKDIGPNDDLSMAMIRFD